MDGEGKTAKELAVIGIFEAIGTAILFVAINFSQGNPLVVIVGVLTGAVLSGRLTGAHFNSAVTIAVWIADEDKKKRRNIKLMIVMLISQILGAYIGQWFAYVELYENIAMIGSTIRPAW
jgi:glycerol uptake facilitator-like aquaporin